MKKKILASTLICGVVLTMAAPVFAANANTTTEGKVKFKQKDATEEGTPVKPGTKDPIKPENGNKTKGPFRIEWVPDFDFGEQKISSKEEVYDAKWNEYQEIDPSNPTQPSTKKKIPAFVQVADERGNNGQFTLSVKQTQAFTPQGGGFGAQPLTNTRIEFTEAQKFLSNDTNGGNAQALQMLNVTAQPVVIPLNQDIKIMGTQGGATVDGNQATVVFNTKYTKNWTGNTSTEVQGDTQPGVKLRIPAGDKQSATVPYIAKFTWTLTDSAY